MPLSPLSCPRVVAEPQREEVQISPDGDAHFFDGHAGQSDQATVHPDRRTGHQYIRSFRERALADLALHAFDLRATHRPAQHNGAETGEATHALREHAVT